MDKSSHYFHVRDAVPYEYYCELLPVKDFNMDKVTKYSKFSFIEFTNTDMYKIGFLSSINISRKANITWKLISENAISLNNIIGVMYTVGIYQEKLILKQKGLIEQMKVDIDIQKEQIRSHEAYKVENNSLVRALRNQVEETEKLVELKYELKTEGILSSLKEGIDALKVSVGRNRELEDQINAGRKSETGRNIKLFNAGRNGNNGSKTSSEMTEDCIFIIDSYEVELKGYMVRYEGIINNLNSQISKFEHEHEEFRNNISFLKEELLRESSKNKPDDIELLRQTLVSDLDEFGSNPGRNINAGRIKKGGKLRNEGRVQTLVNDLDEFGSNPNKPDDIELLSQTLVSDLDEFDSNPGRNINAGRIKKEGKLRNESRVKRIINTESVNQNLEEYKDHLSNETLIKLDKLECIVNKLQDSFDDFSEDMLNAGRNFNAGRKMNVGMDINIGSKESEGKVNLDRYIEAEKIRSEYKDRRLVELEELIVILRNELDKKGERIEHLSQVELEYSNSLAKKMKKGNVDLIKSFKLFFDDSIRNSLNTIIPELFDNNLYNLKNKNIIYQSNNVRMDKQMNWYTRNKKTMPKGTSWWMSDEEIKIVKEQGIFLPTPIWVSTCV
jgi:hypothetical protein